MFKPKQITCPNASSKTHKASAILIASLALIASAAVSAQETDQSNSSTDAIEEVVVVGTRQTLQRSIDLKRNSTQIVDGMSADEIGDIPALSIGEALELVTGATSHRENGGATEISVRGLGPFLGTTVVNGREATNGGGNRAVNFSIFPSEMFNKIAIHKTQSAEYIEGAVSGQIHLDTKKPLDYGKRLAQADVKLAYSPDESDIQGGQDYGSRATFAYIDQFEFDNGVRLGFSLGVQARDETNPEQEYQTTSGGGRLEACELTSFDSNALPTDIDGGRCEDGVGDVSNDQLQGLIDSNPNYNSVADVPFAYIPRDHRYRQNTTDDEREAIFGSVQLQPNDRLDVTFDFQYSERDQREFRRDLQFGTTQEDISALTSNPATGVVYSSVSETDINTFTTDFQRLEKYEGYGINFDYSLSDNLSLSLDYAKSDTDRTETDVELRLGATYNNILANRLSGNRDDFPVRLDVNQGSGAAIATILDNGGNGFEVTDPSYFNARDRARLRARQIIRDNALDAIRADLAWTRDSGAIHTVKAGVRSSSMEYFTWGGDNATPGRSLFEDEDLVTPDGTADNAVTDAILANVLACAEQSFPESGFLSNVRDAELITNASSGTAVSSFATFNPACAYNAWLANYGGLAGIRYLNGITSGTNDVKEDTLAFYVQADFETEFSGYPVRGNFGVRFVDTDITSVGYRTAITVEQDQDGYFISEVPGGGFETDTQKSDYQEVLPSLTVIVDLDDDLILRSGLFRGMSRPDPDAYGNGRAVRDNSGDSIGYASLAEAVNGITATGNPYLKPILSTNLDLGLEWYPNADTMVAAAIYWKEFNGAFETVAQLETFNLDGNPVQGLIETTQISNDDSTIKGLELSLSHSFNYLPGFWSGFGGKISYNYADSDFEFEDQHGGDGVQILIDQDTGEVTQVPLVGIIPPANLFGLSKHVSSTQLYWDSDKWDVQLLYKTRSDYFQQYTRDTQGRIRYTDDNTTLDMKIRYKLFDNVDVNLEAKNILDEPRIDYRAVQGNVLQALSYGPRVFLGVKAKF
jgi:TonB-dependent receptor